MLIEASGKFKSRQIERMIGQLGDFFEKADSNFGEFRKLAMENFPDAVRRLPEFIAAARNINGSRGYESMAGGPNQDWIVPLFNVFGSSYSELDVETRTAILRHILNYLNSLRYDYSQNHVELMECGALVADIVVNGSLYWPGLDRPKYQLTGKGLDKLKLMPHDELDSFWIALAIIYNNEYGTLPVRQWYYKEFHDAVQGAIDYLGPVFASSADAATKEHSTAFEDELVSRLNKRLDPAIHERVRAKIAERSWIVLPR